MGELITFFGFVCLVFGSVWLGFEIRQYIDDRRYWKWVESHFEAKRKEHNEKILKAFEKALESEPIKEYLIKVFSEAKQRKENESN